MKYNIFKLSIRFSLIITCLIFVLNYYHESIIFNLKNIIAILIFFILNITAFFLQIFINKAENKYQNNIDIVNRMILRRYSISKILYATILSIILCCFFILYFSKSLSFFPKRIGIINDYPNVFTETDEKQLENFLNEFTKKQYFDSIIVIVENTNFYKNPQKYFIDLKDYWLGIMTDDIVLFGYCVNCNFVCIIPSKNLLNKLNENVIRYIIKELIIPEFKQKKYFEGFNRAIIDLYTLMGEKSTS